MDVNVENILELFHSKSSLFDREGRLLVQCGGGGYKDSQQEFRECVCRLKGNLLLLAEIEKRKTNDLFIHLLVLNNFEVKLSADWKDFEFCIVLNHRNVQPSDKYFFCCESRSERDKWIESIYLASYNFLVPFHKALSEQYSKHLKPQKCEENLLVDSTRFMIIKCDNILCSVNFEPDLFVKVFFRRSFIDQCWRYLGHTETIASKSPQFSTGIRLPNFSPLEFKFELHNVIERQFDISFLFASAYFYLRSASDTEYFRTKLVGTTKQNFVGSISFKVAKTHPQVQRSLSLTVLNRPGHILKRSTSVPNMVTLINPTIVQNDLFNNTISRQFVFNVLQRKSSVMIEEQMSESKFVFLIPQILLKLFAHDEETISHSVQQFIAAHSVQSSSSQNLLDFHHRLQKIINESQIEIVDYMSRFSFRSSKNKTQQFLQFVPINFHKQKWFIDFQNSSTTRSVITAGAYACHHLGFPHSQGLKTLLTNFNDKSVIETLAILKKLLIVLRCETKINKQLEEIEGLAKNDNFDLRSIEEQYQTVDELSRQVNNIVSTLQLETILAEFNTSVSSKLNISDDEFLQEPIDLIYLNIKACLVAINYKLSNQQLQFSDIESCNRKLKSAIESLRKVIIVCYLTLFSRLSREQIDSLYQLRYRHLCIFTQALTTFTIVAMDRVLNSNTFLEQVHHQKYILLEHETLLSCFQNEFGMLDDMVYALDELANSVVPVFRFTTEPPTLMPDIQTFGEKFKLIFHVRSLPGKPEEEVACKIISLIFNIGVNHHASMASKCGNNYQRDLNEASFNKLKGYITMFAGNNKTISVLLNQLSIELHSKKSKNIQILNLAGVIVHGLNGIKITCCKSAKDRTGMSVTLEEVRHCFSLIKLNEETEPDLFQTMLDTLRRNGTRIENVGKNIGCKKYAFSYIQLLTFPRRFKPPSGTYSVGET